MQCGAKNDQDESQTPSSEKDKFGSIQFRYKKENGFVFIIKGKERALCTIRFLLVGGGHPKAVLQVSTPVRMDFDELSELSSFMQYIIRLIGNVEESSKVAWESKVEEIFKANFLI
jgi:hypothetical protein